MIQYTALPLGLTCLISMGLSCCNVRGESPAGEWNGFPEWVKGEAEAVATMPPVTPAYLRVTKTATVFRPRPLRNIEELEKLNPGLIQALPKLPQLLQTAEVSSKFQTLYDEKIKVTIEEGPMSLHDYFDCATVLNLTDPATGRKAVLFQSDMDVDTDGTDPVRFPLLSDYNDARVSRSFQPVLSYSWAMPKAEWVANPFLAYYDQTLARLTEFRDLLKQEGTKDKSELWKSMWKPFDERIKTLRHTAKVYTGDLRTRRSLIARLDPFIVVPQTWIDKLKMPLSIEVGDFVAVIYGGKVYPGIIGDEGPGEKIGEASQVLAQAINPQASGRNGAVDEVRVTYILFPQTGKATRGAPDLMLWQKEVERLLGEMGGLGEGVVLHHWEADQPQTTQPPVIK